MADREQRGVDGRVDRGLIAAGRGQQKDARVVIGHERADQRAAGIANDLLDGAGVGIEQVVGDEIEGGRLTFIGD